MAIQLLAITIAKASPHKGLIKDGFQRNVNAIFEGALATSATDETLEKMRAVAEDIAAAL